MDNRIIEVMRIINQLADYLVYGNPLNKNKQFIEILKRINEILNKINEENKGVSNRPDIEKTSDYLLLVGQLSSLKLFVIAIIEKMDHLQNEEKLTEKDREFIEEEKDKSTKEYLG